MGDAGVWPIQWLAWLKLYIRVITDLGSITGRYSPGTSLLLNCGVLQPYKLTVIHTLLPVVVGYV